MKLTADNEAINYLRDYFNKDFIEITVDGEKKIFVSEEKLKEKDKIIDLMAEEFEDLKLAYFKKEDGGEFMGKYRTYNKNDWKEYFERKVENETSI